METKHKFTPGPWTISESGNTNQYGSGEVYIDAFDSGVIELATVWLPTKPTSKEHAIANAKLIAAAPDLLEALEEIGKRSCDGVICAIAEKAIKKATEFS